MTSTKSQKPTTPDTRSDKDIANDELVAFKSALQNGETPPPTPTLAKVSPVVAAKLAKESGSTKSKSPKTPKVRMVYAHDGHVMDSTHNRLSALAFYFTKGIATPNSPRVGVDDFVDLLVKGGAKDPRTAKFLVKLPNGHIISGAPGELGDDKVEAAVSALPKSGPNAPDPKPAKVTAAKKTPAKKSTAPKSTKKTTAPKKSTGSRKSTATKSQTSTKVAA